MCSWQSIHTERIAETTVKLGGRRSRAKAFVDGMPHSVSGNIAALRSENAAVS